MVAILNITIAVLIHQYHENVYKCFYIFIACNIFIELWFLSYQSNLSNSFSNYFQTVDFGVMEYHCKLLIIIGIKWEIIYIKMLK